MPSVHEAAGWDSSRAAGCASARFAHPHEQLRPFESSGHSPPAQSQWDPRGGSTLTRDPARETAMTAMKATTVASLQGMVGG
jgi:hypothetical protein